MPDIVVKAPKGASYNVIIERSFDRLKDELEKISITGKVCLISDNKVMGLYGDSVKAVLTGLSYETISIIYEELSGESIDEKLDSLNTAAASSGITSEDCIVALGGAVITDFSAYVSSLLGAGLVNIPTSISSMADIAVDGKAGDIIENMSNVEMAIVFPKLVYCNIACIESLEPADYYSGFAYIMRTAIVKSSSVYEWLIDKLYEISDRDMDIVSDMIEQNINLKRIYMEKDPLYTKGDLRLLEFGNSLAWAFYSIKSEELTFGECLALGVIASSYISMKKDMLSLDEYLEIRDMFVPFNLPISVENIDVDEVVSLSHKFIKKDEQGQCFILLKKLGKAVIDRNVTDDEIKAAISEIRFSDDDFIVE